MFAIRAGHTFDGEDFRSGGATVLVDEGGIVGVEPVAYEPPSDCELLDYGDATVLPWIVASGPPITTRGGHCGYLGGEVSGADEIVAAVRGRVERRVDVVKVMASGGMGHHRHRRVRPAVLDRGAAAAGGAGTCRRAAVTAHAHAAAAVDQAVAVGVEGHRTRIVRNPIDRS